MTTDHLDALELLSDACQKHGIHLSVLVAETGLWVSPKVHEQLLERTGQAAFYPDRRRARIGAGEVRGGQAGSIRFDDNTYPNTAIKRCIGMTRTSLVGFETCHIWPKTCYDPRHHTALSNLALLPRPLAALSDHEPEIEAALQYRSFELYGWHPEGTLVPEKPPFYPDNWREPMGFSALVERALQRRVDKILDGLPANSIRL